MEERPQDDFDMAIQRHLTRAHKLRAIQQMIDEDPELVPELLEILTHAPVTFSVNVAQGDVHRRTDSRTQAEKVIAYFRNRSNTMASVREIAEATGLTRNTINALLYNSGHKNLFKSLKIGPKKKLWHLKEDENDSDSEMSLDELEELGLSENDLG